MVVTSFPLSFIFWIKENTVCSFAVEELPFTTRKINKQLGRVFEKTYVPGSSKKAKLEVNESVFPWWYYCDSTATVRFSLVFWLQIYHCNDNNLSNEAKRTVMVSILFGELLQQQHFCLSKTLPFNQSHRCFDVAPFSLLHYIMGCFIYRSIYKKCLRKFPVYFVNITEVMIWTCPKLLRPTGNKRHCFHVIWVMAKH